MPKQYLTHDNGGRPYLVKIRGKTVTVFKRPDSVPLDDDDYSPARYTVLVKTFKNVAKVFVGMDHNANNAHLPRHFGDGNTFLLYLGQTGSRHKYASINHKITLFYTRADVIQRYYSNIGNSDVPYPVAVGKDYVYFMRIGKRIDKSAFAPGTDWADAYTVYYGQTDDPWYEETYGKSWTSKGFGNTRTKLKKFVQTFPGLKVIDKGQY